MKSANTSIDLLRADVRTELALPLAGYGVSAGFPSPAEDFLDTTIDLNKELIRRPSSTFFGRVRGQSLKDLGIHHGDLLVIDKSLKPVSGRIAVCFLDGEFTVKVIELQGDRVILHPANPDYKPITVTEGHDFQIWGMVTYTIKNVWK